MKEILRKCTSCDKTGQKTINVDTEKFIYYEGKYYHFNCYVKYKKKNNEYNLSDEQIINSANELVIKTKLIKKVNDTIDRDRLTYWLYENYNISVLPSLFFSKLQRINEGTFSNRVGVSISNYDLLQIFKKMKSYLDKINNKNERNGKTFEATQRINYDLSVVINNYDEYLKWKQKQKTEVVEKQQIQEDIKSKNSMDINNITVMHKNNENIKNNNSTEINISDLLDEVF